MEFTTVKLAILFHTSLIWFTMLPFSLQNKDVSGNDNSHVLFEGNSFLEQNMTEISLNSKKRECETRLWFKPTKRQGVILALGSDDGLRTVFGLKDGYLRSFVVNQTNQSQSTNLGKPITMVTMNQWLHLSVGIRSTVVSYSLLDKPSDFTGILNQRTGFDLVYVGGVPVAWTRNVKKPFQNFTGYIKGLIVACKTDASESLTLKSASFRCQGTCNLQSSTRERNGGQSASPSKPSLSRKPPLTTQTTNPVLKKPQITLTVNTTQKSGFVNDSLEVDEIDIIMTNSKRSPPQDTARVSGIAKIYKVTVILIIFLFAAVLLYVLGMIVKSKIQQYRAKLREERQMDIMGRNESFEDGGAEDENPFNSNRQSNLCDIETGTYINEQQTSRFWRERGERLLMSRRNHLRMSASTQSLNSNLNDMENDKVKYWREERKKGNQMRMSASTYSLSSRRSSAPVCESSLFVTPCPLPRKRERTSSTDIPRVVLTSAQDDKVLIKRDNPLKNIQERATNTLTDINGKMPDKEIRQQRNKLEGLRREAKNKSIKSADKSQRFTSSAKENTHGKMSYKWAYIRPDSETECSETERMKQPCTTFRPFSLRILETNESEEEEEAYNNKKKSIDDFQTFRFRSSDNICRAAETMKISYDPCFSSSQGERLVCFGIHSASSDPSVVSSSRANLMCDCAIQQRLHSSCFHDTASVVSEWDCKLQFDAFLDSIPYEKRNPKYQIKEDCSNHLQVKDGHQSRQNGVAGISKPSNKPDGRTQQILKSSKEARVPNIPPPPPFPPPLSSSKQLKQKRREQLQLNHLPSFVIPNEMQITQEKNDAIGQGGHLLRQPKVDLPNPRPHSSCSFTRKNDDEDSCPPITMTHVSLCDSLPSCVVTPASSKNSKECFDNDACIQLNNDSSPRRVNEKETQRCKKPMMGKSRDIPVASSNGLHSSAQQVKPSPQEKAKEPNEQTSKKFLPQRSCDITVAGSNGLKNPWIVRPKMLSEKNERGAERKVLHTKQPTNRCLPRQGVRPMKYPSCLLDPPDNDDGGDVEKNVWRRSSWASGNRPSEFELALKGTVPVKRPPSNTSVLLKVPGSRTRPQSETMF